MYATEICKSTTNILKLMFFAINLHFVKSSPISTYRKLNLPPTSSIYFVFLSLEMQKRLEQAKVYCSFSYFVLKETNPQIFKSGSCKNLFLQCVHYWYNLFRWAFFILYDNWKTLLFVKVYRYTKTFEAPCCCFLFFTSVLKEVRILYCLHNNNMILIPKFEAELFARYFLLVDGYFLLVARCFFVQITVK